VLLAQVDDAGAARFEDPQPAQAEECDDGGVVTVADRQAVVIRASNCRWPRPTVGGSAGTEGRRTWAPAHLGRQAVCGYQMSTAALPAAVTTHVMLVYRR
jgi:hypothetical protein